GVDECHVDGAIGSDGGHRPCVLIAGCATLGTNAEGGGARDFGAAGEGVAPIMRDNSINGRADVASLVAVVEDGPGDDHIPRPPGREILLIVKGAYAAKGAGASRHTHGLGPGYTFVSGVGHQDVWVGAAAVALGKQEAKRGYVDGAIGIKGHGRVASGDVAAIIDRVEAPAFAPVKGHVCPRVD